MIPCRIALIFSRSESSSSSTCWPSTERSVVCAFCEVATMKFSTCTIASFGSTIRKYATAFTRTGTLSFVMTSCGGMFSVIVRRSTFTIRSTIGIRRKRPGPFGSGEQPAEPEDDPALVLARDLDRRDQEEDDEEDDDGEGDESGGHRAEPIPHRQLETVDAPRRARARPARARRRRRGARARARRRRRPGPACARPPPRRRRGAAPTVDRPPPHLHRLRERERPEERRARP